jgi:acetyl-CoA synthetase
MEQNWLKISERLMWSKKPTTAGDFSFNKPVSIKWFEDGVLNVSVNCIDRHLSEKSHQTALIWEPDNTSEASKKVTYLELSKAVNKLANILKKHNVKKGDRVTIYMPMIVEAVYAMLACSRIGAVHSVIFGGFSPDSIANRIEDCDSHFVITADEGWRAGRKVKLKKNVDEALQILNSKNLNPVKKVLMIKRTNAEVDWNPNIDIRYEEELKSVSEVCEPELMRAEDPLFILYTSGSTGKPKGVLHTTGGYLTYVSYTHELVFGYQSGEVYWCTADVGWITGHSYIVYGPLANAATTLLFEGVPHYPTVSRFWEVIDKHQVNIFYTAPTAIRALMREGEDPLKSTSRKSLRLLGSVGEPINPEAWTWYYKNVGHSNCRIVDTWWQTETGGILISPTSNAPEKLKPGSATQPLPGIKPEILSAEGEILKGASEGVLVLKSSWPGQMRTLYKDHARFEETYFSAYPGYYFTGDGSRRDEDGYYWITGRVDDVLNISGHRIGTAEVESALVGHHSVSEAAVVGYSHDIKGQAIYAFVTLKTGINPTEALKTELVNQVRQEIGAIASPDIIQWAPALPKTRSGKIMRRILRKIAENQLDSLGDTSTLADPNVLKELVENRISK